jgi:anti-sigma factor (TIGR02949 family)
MSNSNTLDLNCAATLRSLDLYLDRQLPEEEARNVARHLEGCIECSREVGARRNLRLRLKQANEADLPSADLRSRISSAVRRPEERKPRWDTWQRQFSAAAAVLVVCIGTLIAYQLGYLRFTTASQDAFIASLSKRVARIMTVGLQDHLHCAVFRKYPNNPPSLEEVREKLPSQYQSLIPALQAAVPPDFRIAIAHECGYGGRRFIHVALKGDSRLMSLVIAVKQPGETFRDSELGPVVAQAGIELYGAGVQKYQMTGFETGEHLAYLVSDLPKGTNTQLMVALAPEIRRVLEKV